MNIYPQMNPFKKPQKSGQFVLLELRLRALYKNAWLCHYCEHKIAWQETLHIYITL